MNSVLFYDPVCRQPYDTRTLRTQAMGGSEATLIRVADALDAFVIQHNRAEDWGRYRQPQRISGISSVIVNRDSRALALVRERYPRARAYLWLHDQLNPGSRRARWLAATAPALREMAVTAVCVSDSQRRGVEATLRGIGVDERVRALTIYNPVDDTLMPDGTPVDERKLVFFSSPNKGLNFTLDAFSALKQRMPDLRLVVGNPGYKAGCDARRAGVELLGPQPQARIHAAVLTHDCGAALEVIGDPRQVLPLTPAYRLYEAAVGSLPPRWRRLPARLAASAGLFDAYLERIRAWRGGERPRTGPDPRFRLSTVTEQWRALLSTAP
jgi:hypothetical protein